MIGLLIALESEAEPFLQRYPAEKTTIGGRAFARLEIDGTPVVLAICGVGKVNAAYTASLLLSRFDPSVLISVGVSGGIGEGLRIGDLVAADRCVQHDVDTSPLGDPKGFVSTVNKVYFDTDEKLRDIFVKTTGAKVGVAASGEQFVASPEKKKFVSDFFHAVVCDMESGAAAQCALIAGKKFLCFRTVSDLADGSAPADFPTFVKEASEKACDAVAAFLREAKRQGYLL